MMIKGSLLFTRISTIKILGVTITNKLSVSDHISSVIRLCAQSLHALRTLHHHHQFIKNTCQTHVLT